MLALLAIEGERSGYDLAKQVEKSIAHVWAPARSGLYAVLPRLERAGLVHSRVVSHARRPDKRLYSVTRAGTRALDAWLETIEPGATDSVYLKIFVGSLTTRDVLLEHVAQFQTDTQSLLALYQKIGPTNTNSGHDWYHRHLLRYGIEQAEHELEWAARVGRALRRGPR